MTIQELLEFVNKNFPNAEVRQDNNDQIIIYTGMEQKENSFELVEFDDGEEYISFHGDGTECENSLCQKPECIEIRKLNE